MTTLDDREMAVLDEGTTWRTAEIYHLPTIISSGMIPDSLFEELTEDTTLDSVFPFLEDIFKEDQENGPCPKWEMMERLIDRFLSNKDKFKRYLVKFECPVFETTDRGTLHYSWGLYRSEWQMCFDQKEIMMWGQEFEKRIRIKAEEKKK